MPSKPKSQEHIVRSSLVSSYEYDHESQELSITLKTNGQTYKAKVSPSEMSATFDRPGSIGKRVYSLLRNKTYQFVIQP
jgi:hypothetical protein